MASSSFQTALYKHCRALYVSPISKLAPRLNLLDVMIKKETEGFLRRRPVLYRVGSLLDLGTTSSKEAQDALREGLQRFWDKGIADDTFQWSLGDVSAFEETLSSASSLSGSLLAGLEAAKLHFSGSSELKVNIGQLDAACVKWEVLGKMMEGKNPIHWKPNVEDFRFKGADGRPIFGGNNIELWVVHDLLHAKTMTIKSASGSQKECKILPGIASTAGLIDTPGLEVTRTRESANSLDLRPVIGGESPASRVPGRSLIAFRLVGFVFDAAGNFIGYKDDPGSVEPIHRAPSGKLSHGDQRAQIRDLYKETAPEFYSDEDDDDDEAYEEDDDSANADLRTMGWPDLQRLPIVDMDGDLDVPLEEVAAENENPQGT